MNLSLVRRNIGGAVACLILAATPAAGIAQQHAAHPAAPHPATPSPQQIYRTHCAECHGDDLQGGAGPALKGAAIASENAADLYTAIKTTMPLGQPGALTDAEYKAITGYLKAESARK